MSGWLFCAVMVAGIFRMLTTGRLRTGREVEEVRKDRDSRVAEAMAWKTAYEQAAKIVETQGKQIERLLGLSEVSAHVLKSLPRAAHPPEEDTNA